jgi:hypothetical protein
MSSRVHNADVSEDGIGMVYTVQTSCQDGGCSRSGLRDTGRRSASQPHLILAGSLRQYCE